MKRLDYDKGFIEVQTPPQIRERVLNDHIAWSIVNRLQIAENQDQAPDSLDGVSVDSLVELFKSDALSVIEGENLLYGINPSEFENFLRDFVVENWDALQKLGLSTIDPLNPDDDPLARYIKEQISVFLKIREVMFGFYKRLQQAIVDLLEEKNFVVGTEERIKNEIYRASNHRGFAVKLCDKAYPIEKPLNIPHHPNFMQTSLFPVKKPDGSNRVIILTEDISGAKRFDKIDLNQIPIEKRMHMLAQAMHGCIHLHNLGLVHHDIKPENMFMLEPEGSEPVCILGDPECVVPDGYEYPVNYEESIGFPQEIPLIFATFEFFDYEYYSYPLETIKTASPAIDTFAFGINIIEQFIGDYDVSRKVLEYISKHNEWEIDEPLLRDAFNEFEIEFNIPENILVILLRCLAYERTQRPCLSDVVQVLEDQYGEGDTLTYIEQTPLTS